MSEREHDLKCWPVFFSAVLDGSKPFEVRLNDRHYRVGDVLRLREWDQTYTGREGRWVVSYVLTSEFAGVESGYVVLGLAR